MATRAEIMERQRKRGTALTNRVQAQRRARSGVKKLSAPKPTAASRGIGTGVPGSSALADANIPPLTGNDTAASRGIGPGMSSVTRASILGQKPSITIPSGETEPTTTTGTPGTVPDLYRQAGDRFQTRALELTDAEIARLKREEADTLRRGEEMTNARIAALQPKFDEARARAQENFETAREDTATRFAYSGFGQSSRLAEAQFDLAQEGARVQSAIDREQALEEALARAQVFGATGEELSSIRSALRDAQLNRAEIEAGFNELMLNVRQQEIQAGQQAALAAQQAVDEARTVDVDTSSLTGVLTNQFGEAITGPDGQPIPITGDFNFGSVITDASGNSYQMVRNPRTGEIQAVDIGIRQRVPGSGGGGGGFGGLLPGVGFDPSQAGTYETIIRYADSQGIDDYTQAALELKFKEEDAINIGNQTFAYLQNQISNLPADTTAPGLSQPLEPTSRAAAFTQAGLPRALNQFGSNFDLTKIGRNLNERIFGANQ